jgi:hypothetical protein
LKLRVSQIDRLLYRVQPTIIMLLAFGPDLRLFLVPRIFVHVIFLFV